MCLCITVNSRIGFMCPPLHKIEGTKADCVLLSACTVATAAKLMDSFFEAVHTLMPRLLSTRVKTGFLICALLMLWILCIAGARGSMRVAGSRPDEIKDFYQPV
jgi:hypothetical protein